MKVTFPRGRQARDKINKERMSDDNSHRGKEMKRGRCYFLKASQGKVIAEEVAFEQRPKRGEGVRFDASGSSSAGGGNSLRLEEQKSLGWLDGRPLGDSRRGQRGNGGQTEGAFFGPCKDFDSA